MAYKIPGRFKRMAAVFHEEVARESSGSEHSHDSDEGSMNLSDLVDSFMESEYRTELDPEMDNGMKDEMCDEMNLLMKKELMELLGNSGNKNIQAAIEKIYRIFPSIEKGEGKRGLMTKLRNKGFDAGLCKLKWERAGKYPSGTYEYVDINESENHQRYIVEMNLANEFEIARPSKMYISLLELFPSIFVGKVEDLKKIVRIMCKAMKDSLKNKDMSMPPWRSHGYQKLKWFSAFKRTTNEFPTRSASNLMAAESKKRWVGFEPGNIVVSSDCDCRRNLGKGRIGLLALALNS